MRLFKRRDRTHPGIQLIIRAHGQEILNMDSGMLYYCAKFGGGGQVDLIEDLLVEPGQLEIIIKPVRLERNE